MAYRESGIFRGVASLEGGLIKGGTTVLHTSFDWITYPTGCHVCATFISRAVMVYMQIKLH